MDTSENEAPRLSLDKLLWYCGCPFLCQETAWGKGGAS